MGKIRTNVFIVFISWIIAQFLKAIIQDQMDLREKVKYFRPTVTRGFWGKKVSWEMRDRPLTEKELDAYT